MSYRLALAEKPSVAQSIAKVLGATKRCEGYLEGNGWLVSWCIGHLVELAEPESYDEKYGKWRYEDLPIFPKQWKYEVSASTRKQFAIVKTLMNREDVTEITECTDSGREGELIYRLVYHQCGCRKPFRRLWISSMEDSAIREGFANLHPSSEYDSLYEAALCRERADWIVGMNATRLFSCLYGQTLAVGRVMTPTLSMVVMRDAAIAAFQPEPFYTVKLAADGLEAESARFKEQSEAKKVQTACQEAGSVVVGTIQRKEKTEKPPALYDLTSLQRDANRMLGFSAQQTLDYTQSLYEKKLVTYPRTDSRYLTEDMEGMIPELARAVAASYGMPGEVPVKAAQVIDGSRVTDHHALLPTRSMPKKDLSALPSGEQAVLRLICARLLSAVGTTCLYAETEVVLQCAGTDFSARGRTMLQKGWREIEESILQGREKEKADGSIPDLAEGDTLLLLQAILREGKTSPPKHYTEDTLLQAMQTAGKEEMPEEAEREGIGTPATRAAIIEKLVQKGFVERRGDKKTKYLCATQKGTALITVMPEQIRSPSMTADWEEKLLGIEKGSYSPGSFMEEIKEMTASLVRTYEAAKDAEALRPSRIVIGICPHCGHEVVERKKGWFCDNRECHFALWKDNAFFDSIGKKLDKGTAEKLLSSGKIRLTGCKSKRTGKTYDTTLILATEPDGKAKFRMDFGKGGGK
ncbi:MAG: DNA topoisomerase 3 [Clostridia bacterium]|nr:DNA topoisomerase 3 [Clostridia bacterium]MBO6269515.1 DNA topoisomerase 3 [Clostridium sp.]